MILAPALSVAVLLATGGGGTNSVVEGDARAAYANWPFADRVAPFALKHRAFGVGPEVRVWLSGDDVYRRGDRARAYFRAEEDAYVTVVRVDTDGRLSILFPDDPHDDHFMRGGQTYSVHDRGHDSFLVDDYPGQGFVFAIASWERFDFRSVSSNRYWDYRLTGDRVSDDPYNAVRDFAERILQDRRAEYSIDFTDYYVEQRYEYPRFLCYNCHAYRPYHVWDPYDHHCVRFRVVVVHDPYYYPYRYGGGSRVVYVRDVERRPRYEFKQVAVGDRVTRDNFIERRRVTSAPDNRRPGSPTSDPNLIEGGRRGSAGATRPGDEVTAGGGSGRRRATSDEPAPGGSRNGLGTPRRDGTDGDDERGSTRGSGAGDDRRAPTDRVLPPRRDAAPRAEPSDPSRDATSRREPRSEPTPGREQPRGEPRRDEPRRDEPRLEPRREPRPEPRAEPRREPAREPRRAPDPPPRAEPRRTEPQRAEPRRTEPKRGEPVRRSPPSRGSDDAARMRRSG